MRLDAVVVINDESLEFLMDGGPLFPGVPVVAYTSRRPESLSGQPVTGLWLGEQMRSTVDLALTLHPGTERVVVIGGPAASAASLQKEAAIQLAPLRNRVQIQFLMNLGFDQLLARVATLPERTVILYLRVTANVIGAHVPSFEALARIAGVARVPIYGISDTYVGRGIVGGQVQTTAASAEALARITRQVIGGSRDLGFARAPTATVFDWRQLRRWNVDERKLPPGSQVLFREISALERYWWGVMAGLSVMGVQAVTIGALLVQRRRRRRADHERRRLLTLMRQEHEARHASEARNTAMLRAMPDVMYLVRRDGTYLDYYARDVRDMCIPPGQLAGRTLSELLPADLAATFMRAIESLSSPESVAVVEYQFPRGEHMGHFEARIVCCGNDAVLAIVRNVTDRRLAEQRLQHAQNEIAHLSRLNALGELAASLTHEVSQPLSAIAVNTRACLRWLDAPTHDENDIRDALRDVAEDSQRAADVIRRVRSLFRKQPVQSVPVDVNGVIGDVISLTRRRIEEAHIRFTVDLPDGLPIVLADPVQLRQVVLNLVMNGIDALAAVPPPERTLEVSSMRNDEGTIVVTVRDTGVGFDASKLEQMFDPVYTTKMDGIGIGRSISRSIVEAHGGRLWATALTPHGAMFQFTLSVSAAAPCQPADLTHVRVA